MVQRVVVAELILIRPRPCSRALPTPMPKKIAFIGLTNPQAGVIATSPATAPVTAPRT